jgi:hypothetical protein
VLLSVHGSAAELPPLARHWRSLDKPLPRRHLCSSRADRCQPPATIGPAWAQSGRVGVPFDFCVHVGRLLEDIVARCRELSHVRVDRILVSVLQARNGRRHGLQARVTPLRFPGGKLTRLRRGVPYQVQRYFLDERELLYVMTFSLPRFLNQDFEDKLITIFHELYHLSPECNGDLRRHAGRCVYHTGSQRHYDRHMAELARAYLAGKPDPALHDFLRLNFAQLEERHAAVLGIVVPRPKIVPILPGSGQCRQAPPAADCPQGTA